MTGSRIRLVVTGTNGQIARSLVECGPAGGFDVVALGRPLLDLADVATLAPALERARPQIIVSAAAFTQAERAEAEPAQADTVNVTGAEALATCARKLAVPIIHLSTAYVFGDGSAAPHRECDPVAPLSVYGRSKLMGERAVAAAHRDHVVLRLSWLYSPFGRNVVTAMLKHAATSDTIRVVDDQIGNPTAAADVGAGVMAVARNLLAGNIGRDGYGVFHMAARGVVTPVDLAEAVFAAATAHGGPSARIIAVSAAEYSSRVRRPANAALDCTKLAAVHGIALPDWRASLPACIDRILEHAA